MDYHKFIVSNQKEEFISIQKIKFRLVPLQVLNVHDDQRKCDYVAVWAACQRWFSMCFMNMIIRLDKLISTAHILHTIKKVFITIVIALLNKKKLEILSKSLQKKPQSMRQFEQPLVQKLIAKRQKLMPYKK